LRAGSARRCVVSLIVSLVSSDDGGRVVAGWGQVVACSACGRCTGDHPRESGRNPRGQPSLTSSPSWSRRQLASLASRKKTQ